MALMNETMVVRNDNEDSTKTLDESLDEMEVGQYRISTMTCIYNFHLEINE